MLFWNSRLCIYWYIPVQEFTCVGRFMMVYHVILQYIPFLSRYIPVYPGTYWYKLVFLFCSLLLPAGLLERCGPASAKRHPLQAEKSLFLHAFLWLLRAVAQPAVASGYTGEGGVFTTATAAVAASAASAAACVVIATVAKLWLLTRILIVKLSGATNLHLKVVPPPILRMP